MFNLSSVLRISIHIKKCCCVGTGNGSLGTKGVKHTLTSLSDRTSLPKPGAGDRGEFNCGKENKKIQIWQLVEEGKD